MQNIMYTEQSIKLYEKIQKLLSKRIWGEDAELDKFTDDYPEFCPNVYMVPVFDGWCTVMRVGADYIGDFALHANSYGHDAGQFESMGVFAELDYDEVEGYLDFDECVERVDKYLIDLAAKMHEAINETEAVENDN